MVSRMVIQKELLLHSTQSVTFVELLIKVFLKKLITLTIHINFILVSVKLDQTKKLSITQFVLKNAHLKGEKNINARQIQTPIMNAQN